MEGKKGDKMSVFLLADVDGGCFVLVIMDGDGGEVVEVEQESFGDGEVST